MAPSAAKKLFMVLPVFENAAPVNKIPMVNTKMVM
jgi:hypothetical protein